MTFLQPFLLWGLPLALLPVVIHLLNRMRHKPKRWAAMAFLMKANRAATRQAKLRELLILLCRVLAIAALVLVLSRPVTGGWFGGLFGGVPDVVLIVLDRSASMETRLAPGEPSRREQALRAIIEAGAVYGGRTRFVLIESALRQPQEIAALGVLAELAATRPTDGAADLPAMLDAAANWIEREKPGAAELWIASDLQATNWDPASSRWAAVEGRLTGSPGSVRARILAFTKEAAANRTLSLVDLQRRRAGGPETLRVSLEVRSTDAEVEAVPLRVESGEEQVEWEASLEGNTTRLTRSFPVEASGRFRSGKIVLPADANARDDALFFVLPPPAQSRAALVMIDEAARRTIELAVAPNQKLGHVCEIITDPAAAEWDRFAVVFWQAPLPVGAAAERLQRYVEGGGVAVFFPPGEASPATFAGRGWPEQPIASEEIPLRVGQWDELEGPLANTEQGSKLPLAALEIRRRQLCSGEKNAWAMYADGTGFMLRDSIGRGQAVWVTTLPAAAWSNLADGPVLVPAVQRWLQQGTVRLGRGSLANVGELEGLNLTSAIPDRDPRIDAGIYQDGERLVAVNRPPREEEAGNLTGTQARQLFRTLPVELWEESGRSRAVQSEVWRALLAAMILFLLGEAILTLPRRAVAPEGPLGAKLA